MDKQLNTENKMMQNSSEKKNVVLAFLNSQFMTGVLQIVLAVVLAFVLPSIISDNLFEYNKKVKRLESREDAFQLFHGTVSRYISLKSYLYYCKRLNVCNVDLYEFEHCEEIISSGTSELVKFNSDYAAVCELAKTHFSEGIQKEIDQLVKLMRQVRAVENYDCNESVKGYTVLVMDIDSKFTEIVEAMGKEIALERGEL